MGSAGNGRNKARGIVLKALALIGGAILLRKLTRSATRWDHARVVANALSGEKFSYEQACRDPTNYFNLRMLTCPAAVMLDGSKVLYFEQRFYMVKPCSKEMKCDVEVGSYAIRDVEEYKNFCERPKSQRPQAEEVIEDIAEHLNTIHLSRCQRGKRCLYEGSTPPGGFPNSWNGASYCTSELAILRNGEVHTWDRGYNDDGTQVWGGKAGPYEFKPTHNSSFSDMYSPLNFAPVVSLEKKIDDSFAMRDL
ncbi:Chromophore lyase [Nymphaea thermarum]|nr:Chromophore lyase [Nymphaea thermarum]